MTSLTRHHIHSIEDDNRRLREAGAMALNVLQQIVTPEKFHASTHVVWAQAVEAETRMRKALRQESVS